MLTYFQNESSSIKITSTLCCLASSTTQHQAFGAITCRPKHSKLGRMTKVKIMSTPEITQQTLQLLLSKIKLYRSMNFTAKERNISLGTSSACTKSHSFLVSLLMNYREILTLKKALQVATFNVKTIFWSLQSCILVTQDFAVASSVGITTKITICLLIFTKVLTTNRLMKIKLIQQSSGSSK